MAGHFTVADLAHDPGWDDAIRCLPGAPLLASRLRDEDEVRMVRGVRRHGLGRADMTVEPFRPAGRTRPARDAAPAVPARR